MDVIFIIIYESDLLKIYARGDEKAALVSSIYVSIHDILLELLPLTALLMSLRFALREKKHALEHVDSAKETLVESVLDSDTNSSTKNTTNKFRSSMYWSDHRENVKSKEQLTSSGLVESKVLMKIDFRHQWSSLNMDYS